MREQSRHRHHRLTNARLIHLAGESFGHVVRRQHRIDAARADLVRPRRHPDDAQRSRRPTHQPTDLFEQRDVSRIEGAQQEHHRIHPRHPVGGHQQSQRALGGLAGQR